MLFAQHKHTTCKLTKLIHKAYAVPCNCMCECTASEKEKHNFSLLSGKTVLHIFLYQNFIPEHRTIKILVRKSRSFSCSNILE